MADSAITLSSLRFRWPKQATTCLDIPHFSIPVGERVFLYGPSGSGKSTLLNLIGGVLQPGQGQLEIVGTKLGTLSSAKRDRFRADHIGFIFQQFNLLPWMSAIDNVQLPCAFSTRRRHQAGGEASPVAEAERLLTHLELPPALWRQAAGTLSIGQQQRVAAARALIGRPELIIADEPTSALDADRQMAFIDLLLRETASVRSTLVFVSHDHRLAKHFDRLVNMTEINHAPLQAS